MRQLISDDVKQRNAHTKICDLVRRIVVAIPVNGGEGFNVYKKGRASLRSRSFISTWFCLEVTQGRVTLREHINVVGWEQATMVDTEMVD